MRSTPGSIGKPRSDGRLRPSIQPSSFIPDGQLSIAGRLTQGAGLALVTVGLAQASGFFQILLGQGALEPGIFRPLMLAITLVLSFLGALAAQEDENHPSGALLLFGGLGLLAGLAALWQVGADSGHAQTAMSGRIDPWIALLGIGAVIIFTWRHGSKVLATAAAVAFFSAVAWHIVTWRAGLDGPATALDLVRAFWSSVDDGVLGWVLDVMLSSVFPLFILGSMLVSAMPPDEAVECRPPVRRLVAALQAMSRRLIPTFAVGSLFVMTRPGIDLLTMAAVWIPTLCVCLAWFWRTLPVELEKTVLMPMRWHDAFSVGAVLATLILALLSGFSWQLSVTIALGAAIITSFINVDVRQRPDIILRRLAQSGIAFAGPLIVAGAAGLVLAVLDHTGLPIDVARLLAGAAGEASFPLLVLAVMAAFAMGLVMPGFAAYLIVTAMIGLALRTVGIAEPTAHLVILVASAAAVAIGHESRSTTA